MFKFISVIIETSDFRISDTLIKFALGPYPDFCAGAYVAGPMLSATQITDDFTTHLNLGNDSCDQVLYVDG